MVKAVVPLNNTRVNSNFPDSDLHLLCVWLTRGWQLAAIKLSRYGEDLLFYLYYMSGGDLLQLLAAVEL